MNFTMFTPYRPTYAIYYIYWLKLVPEKKLKKFENLRPTDGDGIKQIATGRPRDSGDLKIFQIDSPFLFFIKIFIIKKNTSHDM